jgi:hypothetical protein
MSKNYLLIIGGMIVIGFVDVLMLLQLHTVRSWSQASTPTPSGLVTAGPSTPIYIPSLPKITDLAPNVAFTDKVTIIIRHADGEREGFLLTTDMADAFLSQLPAGNKVEDIIPPQSLVGHEPPTAHPASGNENYSSTPDTVIGTPPSGP